LAAGRCREPHRTANRNSETISAHRDCAILGFSCYLAVAVAVAIAVVVAVVVDVVVHVVRRGGDGDGGGGGAVVVVVVI
jgi:hypothetical protein